MEPQSLIVCREVAFVKSHKRCDLSYYAFWLYILFPFLQTIFSLGCWLCKYIIILTPHSKSSMAHKPPAPCARSQILSAFKWNLNQPICYKRFIFTWTLVMYNLLKLLSPFSSFNYHHPNINHHSYNPLNEHCTQVVSTAASCSGGPPFKSQPADQWL